MHSMCIYALIFSQLWKVNNMVKYPLIIVYIILKVEY